MIIVLLTTDIYINHLDISGYLTLSHLKSKAHVLAIYTDVLQLTVVHNLCTTLVVGQNIHTITTEIDYEQQQN